MRKIELAAWTPVPDGFTLEEVPADRLTAKQSDLRTHENELSFWRFDLDDPTWQDNAVLAIVGGWKTLNDGLHFAWIDQSDLETDGVTFEPSPGTTFCKDLQDKHVDAVRLDVLRLAKIACHLAKAIRGRSQFATITQRDIIARVADAVEARRIYVPNLPQQFQEPVKAELAARAPGQRQ